MPESSGADDRHLWDILISLQTPTHKISYGTNQRVLGQNDLSYTNDPVPGLLAQESRFVIREVLPFDILGDPYCGCQQVWLGRSPGHLVEALKQTCLPIKILELRLIWLLYSFTNFCSWSAFLICFAGSRWRSFVVLQSSGLAKADMVLCSDQTFWQMLQGFFADQQCVRPLRPNSISGSVRLVLTIYYNKTHWGSLLDCQLVLLWDIGHLPYRLDLLSLGLVYPSPSV